jgi:hypothetical protein
MESDWHSRAARLLSTMVTEGSNSTVKAVKSLKIIPLQDSRWVSSKSSNIYFPSTDHTAIPIDLGLGLVDAIAVSNVERKDLLSQLGVTNVRPNKVIPLIYSRYEASTLSSVNLLESSSHLRYLYWYLEVATTLDPKIFLIDDENKRVFRYAFEHIYFEEKDEEYGPRQLFQRYSTVFPSVPGLDIHYLHTEYLNAVPDNVLSRGRSWKAWLAEFADVKSYPQLRDPGSTKLSREFKYLASHRSNKLIGLLQRYWSSYESEVTSAVADELKICNLYWNQELRDLQSMFLPVPKLKAIVVELNISKFPFLSLPQQFTLLLGDQHFQTTSISSVSS